MIQIDPQNYKESFEYISKKINDPIVERRLCEYSDLPFAIFQGDKDFYHKIGPNINGIKYPCLPPIRCPHERRRQKLSFRTNNRFYRNTCSLTGRAIISMYSPEKPYTVYHQDARYSDQRDPLDYGQNYQSNIPFFQQYKKLLNKVPKMALANMNNQNSQYANYTTQAKDCYMSTVCYMGSENISYSFRSINSQHCSNCYHITRCQYCIGCSDLINSSQCYFVHESNNTNNCLFSTNLENCQYCLFCHNLSNKQYCIRNIQYTKEEYNKQKKQIKENDNYHQQWIKEFHDILKKRTVPAIYKKNCHESIGNDLHNCNNAIYCNSATEFNNARYSRGTLGSNLRDMSGWDIEMALESINVWIQSTHFIACTSVFNSHHMYYCDNCYQWCAYCFGCVWLRNKQYCIFNQQYNKSDYFDTIEQLIQDMITQGIRWHFPPSEVSPFGYNETRAHELYPLTKEEAITWWRKRHNEKQKTPQQKNNNNDPNIKRCPLSQKAFRITQTERDLYQKWQAPLPTTHPDERYKELHTRRAWEILYLRHCDRTNEKILSVYSANATQKVYSPKAYQEEYFS